MMESGFLSILRDFVEITKLHPVLVNFTASLIPVSVASDWLANYRKDESLRHTAWWTMVYAMIITPFTAITGWLFWMNDDNGVTGMTIHKWLGTGLVVLLFNVFLWRFQIYRAKRQVPAAYLLLGLILIALLTYQGHLGGEQVFSDM